MANVEEIIIKVNTESSTKSVKDLRLEMKDLKDQMLNLQEGTDEYNAALARAAEIQHQFKETNESIKQSAGDLGTLFKNTTDVIGGMVQGVGALTAGMQMLGIENEGVVEGIAKLQQISAIASGVKGLEGVGKSAGFLMKNITALTAGTKVASVATSIWNAILYANPVVLIVVGVAALVAGIVALVSIMSSNNEKQKVANKLLGDYDLLVKTNTENNEYRLRVMEAEGASNRRIIIEKQQMAQAEFDLMKIEIKRLENVNNKTKAEKEKLKELQSVKESHIQKMIDLEDDLKIEEIKILKKSSDEKKKIEEDKEKDLIRIKEQKAKEKLETDKKLKESELESISKTQEDIRKSSLTELQILTEEYNKKVELFKKYNVDISLIESDYNKKKKEIEDEKIKNDAQIQSDEYNSKLERDRTFYENQLQYQQLKFDELQLITEQGYLNGNLIEYEYQQESLNNNIANMQALLANEQLSGTERLNYENELLASKRQLDQLELDSKMATVDAIGNILGNASRLFGEHTIAAKGLATAEATINTFKSAQSAYSSLIGLPVVGPVLAPIAAGLAVAAGLKNIQEINKVKVPTPPGTTPPPGGVNPPSISAPPAPSLPSIPKNISQTRQVYTNDEVNLQNQPVKAYVVESEISSVQKRVNQTQNESSF